MHCSTKEILSRSKIRKIFVLTYCPNLYQDLDDKQIVIYVALFIKLIIVPKVSVLKEKIIFLQEGHRFKKYESNFIYIYFHYSFEGK